MGHLFRLSQLSDPFLGRAPTAGDRKSMQRRWYPAAALAVILVAAFGLRAYHLGAECFDEDELYAVYIQGVSPIVLGKVVARDTLHTNHPPLMTVPFLFWNEVVGTTETHVRALPLIFSLLSIVLVYRLGVLLGSHGAGVFAAAVVAFNPLHIAYAQEARHYAFLCFLVTSAHFLFVRCLQSGQFRFLSAYFAVCVLTALTHYFGVLALTAHAVLCAWMLTWEEPASRLAAGRVLLTLLLAGVLCSPLIIIILFQISISPQWTHMSTATSINIANCLIDVAGVRTDWGASALGASIVAFVILLGLRHARGASVVSALSDGSPPLPRQIGVLLVVVGVSAVGAALWLVPRLLLPAARTVIEAETKLSSDAIERELNVVFQLLVAAPTALTLAGLILLAWPMLMRLIARASPVNGLVGRPVPLPTLLCTLLVTPVLATWVVGLLGIQFLQIRNFIIMIPTIVLGLGFGLIGLCRSRPGRVAVVCLGAILIGLATGYRPVARILGGDGYIVGSHTADWRSLGERLRESDLAGRPVVAAQTPFTDPIRYYLLDHAPQRVPPTPEALATLPDRFALIHVAEHRDCSALLSALHSRGVRLRPVAEIGCLIVFDATVGAGHSEGGGNHNISNTGRPSSRTFNN